MSARIEEILEVIEEVRSGFFTTMSTHAFRAQRIGAVERVADLRRIDRTTVSDKFRRQLQPHIANTADFDERLRSWLSSGDIKLRDALLAHSESDEDEAAIWNYFSAKNA